MNRPGRRLSAIVGFVAALVVAAIFAIMPERFRVPLRENLFDVTLAMVRTAPPGVARNFAVVDIDRESLAAIGPWPWPRAVYADLIDAAIKGGARAVVLDVVFSGPDQRSPGTMARRLAEETGDPAIARIAETLVDGDRKLAASLLDRPIVLSLLLDPAGRAPARTAPVLTREGVELRGLWATSGSVLPIPELVGAGLGAGSIQGDADGVIRRVPLLVRVGDAFVAGLAAEALRVSAEASGHLVAGPGLTLETGEASVALSPDGLLRLLPPRAAPAFAQMRAVELLRGVDTNPALRGAIVFVGASAPEIGGLRPSLLGPLTPSVDLQALAAWQMAAGISPRPLSAAVLVEPLLALLGGLAAILAVLALPPARAAIATLGLAAGILGGTIAAAAFDLLLDPMPVLAAIAAAFLVSSLVEYALSRWREATLRRRFEQHLAPAVVARIAADPGSLRLSGERRRITALFTDIEDFSATAATVTPEELIAVLDSYFEGVANIVVQHGGMIDKFVGDAVHAFFNVPFDLDAHADRAVACAVEIIRWTETHRREGLAGRIGLGRTRIGVETGDAVVGDVGQATKLDYTAHGPAVNIAARLEGLNRQLGTAVCVGPGAAAGCSEMRLRPLGPVEVRGAGRLELYTPIDR